MHKFSLLFITLFLFLLTFFPLARLSYAVPATQEQCKQRLANCEAKRNNPKEFNDCVTAVQGDTSYENCIAFSPGFKLPSLGDVLTFVIRLIFIGAGILALFYLIRGAFMYITSGGDAKKTESAQHMIQAAVVGVILLVVVFAIVATLEQVVFAGRLGLGVTVPLTIPGLIE